MDGLTLLAVALPIDAALGYPAAVFRWIGHPVTWVGALIAWLDGRLNPWAEAGGLDDARALTPALSRRREREKEAWGVVGALAVVVAAGLPAWGVQWAVVACLPRPWAMLVLGLLASTLVAQRSLWDHVRAVEVGLRAGLPQGRAAVGMIVGRDTAVLDGAGVARAAIESLAENFADGVVAPAFWCAVLGLPGIAIYKAINTADSMIGHRTPRHAAYGWAAARLDDLVNLPASRLAAGLLTLAAIMHGDARAAAGAVLRDARHHRSPNAGWPEAAMAGALGLRLAGPRVYGGAPVDDAWMGRGRADATADDIGRALRLFRTACAIAYAGLMAWVL